MFQNIDSTLQKSQRRNENPQYDGLMSVFDAMGLGFAAAPQVFAT